jgi:hypothetical protein
MVNNRKSDSLERQAATAATKEEEKKEYNEEGRVE